MAKVNVGMAVSVDALVADRNGSVARLSDPAALRGTDGVESAIAQAKAGDP